MSKRWQVPVLTGVKFDRRGESQKTIVTIEFTALTLCWVRNFIRIEAFAVLRPKLWPDRWQVPTLTGVIITKNYCHQWTHRPRFVKSTKFHQNWSICCSSSKTMAWKMTGANIGRYQESQKTIVINEFSTFKLFSMQSFVENC